MLINGQTASAAEILAGSAARQPAGRAAGHADNRQGLGANAHQAREGQGAIKLTTARYRTPSGRDIDRQTGEKSWGINPDEGYFVAVSRDRPPALHGAGKSGSSAPNPIAGRNPTAKSLPSGLRPSKAIRNSRQP